MNSGVTHEEMLSPKSNTKGETIFNMATSYMGKKAISLEKYYYCSNWWGTNSDRLLSSLHRFHKGSCSSNLYKTCTQSRSSSIMKSKLSHELDLSTWPSHWKITIDSSPVDKGFKRNSDNTHDIFEKDGYHSFNEWYRYLIEYPSQRVKLD